MQPNITIPRAVQLVLDDVGWREGWGLDDSGGPWRAGVDRLLGPQDYEAITQLGERLNMRPQAAMVMCEWDRENVCARCPTCTQPGAEWDNSSRVGVWADEAAEVFRERAANIELTMHGVGHEYWLEGARVRAEWYDAANRRRWPWDDLVRHLDVFTQLLDQHGLGPRAGHRFPSSAVPCAFNFYLDDGDPESTGALYRRAGVQRCSTPFGGGIHFHSDRVAPDGGYDHGLVVIDRGGSGIPYDVYDRVPAGPTRNSICGIHWPNLLMEEPDRNGESVARWGAYLATLEAQPDMMLAANSAECFAQWAYCTFVDLACEADSFILDGSAMPRAVLPTARQAPMWLKVRLPEGVHISAIQADRLVPVAYHRAGEYALLGLHGMQGVKARVHLELGTEPPRTVALRTGTHNVLALTDTLTETTLYVEVYGHAQIGLCVRRPPASILTDNRRVKVNSVAHDAEEGVTTLSVSAHDIQGERVHISIGHSLSSA